MSLPISRNLSAFIVSSAFLAAAFSGCSSLRNIPGAYQIDIQQGNVITQEMLDQLESGMDRRKVRFILGTAMLTDTFNENRWDYFYSLKQGTSNPVQRRISIFFEDNKLARVDGDIRRGDARRPVTPRKETIVTVPPNTEGEGFFSALKPDFLGAKKKAPRVEDRAESTSSPAPEGEATGETPAVPATQDVETISAAPATVPVPSAQDEVYLQRLFEGFGKTGAGSAAGSSDGERAATSESVVYEDDDLGIARTVESGESDDAAASDGGFIKRLIDRLRRPTDSTDTQQSAETPAPPAAPETAAP